MAKLFILVAAYSNHQTPWRLFLPTATKGWCFRVRERCRRNWVNFEGFYNMEESQIITQNLVGNISVRTLQKPNILHVVILYSGHYPSCFNNVLFKTASVCLNNYFKVKRSMPAHLTHRNFSLEYLETMSWLTFPSIKIFFSV